VSWRGPVTKTALLLMEALWVYALTAFFVAVVADGGKPSLLGAGAVVFASFGISRLLQSSELSLAVLRVWGVILSFLVFYVIVRLDFFADLRLWDFSWADELFNATEATLRDKAEVVVGIPLLWAFWMRGVLRGQQQIGFENVVGTFAIGLVVITFVEVFEASDAPWGVGGIAVPYVAVGLLAIGLAHAGRAEAEYGRSFDQTWLIAVGGTVLVLGALAFLFVLLDFGTLTEAAGTAGRGVGWVVARAASYLLWPFLWLAEVGLRGIGWLLERVFEGAERPEPFQEPEGEEEPSEEEEDQQTPAWLRLIVRIFVGGTLVTLLLVSTWYLFSRFRRRLRPGELKESTYQEGRLAADIGDLIGGLLGRLRPNLSLRRDQLEPVRRLYFDVLEAGEQRGVQRRPGETPLELAPRLDGTFAAPTPGRITAAFDDVRYGGIAPPATEVRRLREEWEALAKR